MRELFISVQLKERVVLELEDSVKFIFKTLIKVPVIIVVTYIIFNLWVFSFSYLKILGVSYVVCNTAIQNNYIPSTERAQLESYFNSMETNMLTGIRFTANSDIDESDRKQYGEEVVAGVTANFQFIWPLMPYDYYDNKVQGIDETAPAPVILSEAERDALRDQLNNNGQGFPITIEYRVPGLRYYADLDN